MSKTTEQYSSQPLIESPKDNDKLVTIIKVSQVWQNQITKVQIRVLDIANKIVVAEMIPNKTPVFLTTVDLEENYRMVKTQTNSR